jgi:phage gpG-like protein
MIVTIELPKEALERVQQALEPKVVLEAMRRVMDLENLLTVSHIQKEKMSFPKDGPSVPHGLRVVSNRLRSSVRASEAQIVGNMVVSSIGSNVKYARVHEFGFDGQVTVREHMRKTAERFSIDDGRRTVSKSQAGKLGLLTKAGKGRKGMADAVPGKDAKVKQHMRKMKLPARAPIQTGLKERMPAYGKRLSVELMRVLKNGSGTNTN